MAFNGTHPFIDFLAWSEVRHNTRNEQDDTDGHVLIFVCLFIYFKPSVDLTIVTRIWCYLNHNGVTMEYHWNPMSSLSLSDIWRNEWFTFFKIRTKEREREKNKEECYGKHVDAIHPSIFLEYEMMSWTPMMSHREWESIYHRHPLHRHRLHRLHRSYWCCFYNKTIIVIQWNLHHHSKIGSWQWSDRLCFKKSTNQPS